MLTKVLEWGRLMAYLEQSTRYIALRQPPQHRPLPLLPRPRGARVAARGPLRRATWTACSTPTARCSPSSRPGSPGASPSSRVTPTSSTASRSGPRPSTPCAACCRRRRCRTSASTARASPTRCCCCACAPIRCPRRGATRELMLDELRKVIPSFLQRVDMPERGGVWTEYLADTAARTDEVVAPAVARRPGRTGRAGRRAVSPWSTGIPKGRTRSSRPCATRARRCPRPEVLRRVRALGAEDRRAIMRAYVGERTNRRHRPGRAFERTDYRFDVVSDYGAFRDLQRHRMLTIEWQDLGPGARLRDARHRGRGRARPTASRRRWRARPTSTRSWPARVPTRRPMPWPSPSASATSCR